MIYYTTPGLSDDRYNSYIIGNQLTEQGTEYKVGKTSECITHFGECVSTIPLANYGINSTAKSAQLFAHAAKYSAEAVEYSAQAAQITDKINNASIFVKAWNYISGTGIEMAREAAELSSAANSAASSASASTAAANSAAIAGTAGKIFGIGLTVVGIGIGVGCGAYFTQKFCEETLDKYVEYYKKNSGKIQNSYIFTLISIH